MREALKWSKNHITGEVIQKTVYKDGHALQGRATIQVIGEDGQIKSETVSENIIHKNIQEQEFYRYAYHQACGNGVPSLYSTGWWQNQMSLIALSTDDEEEGEDKYVHKGSIIGYCPRTDTNAGSDAKRGVYNPNESWSKRTEDGYMHYHLVYDFGTSQANGTFSSVWWDIISSTDYSRWKNSVSPIRAIPRKNATGLGIVDYIRRDVKGNYYQYKDGKYFKITNFHKHINGYAEAKTSENHDTSFVSYLYTFADGTRYVKLENVVNGTGTSWKNMKFDIVVYDTQSGSEISRTVMDNFEAYFPELSTYIPASPHSGLSIQPTIKVVTEEGYVVINFYLYSGSSGSSYQYFPYYNGNTISGKTHLTNVSGQFNANTKTWKKNPKFDVDCMRLGFFHTDSSQQPSNIVDKFLLNGCEFFITTYTSYGSYALYYITNKDTLSSYSYIGVGDLGWNGSYSSSYPRAFGCYCREYKALIPNKPSSENSVSSSLQHALYVIQHHSAHTKLPSPVTKTSADTMKVQYDYLIQIPRLFTDNGDFITMPEN